MRAPDHMAVGDEHAHLNWVITLDGVKQEGVVVEYDIPEGWLRRYVREDGRFVMDCDEIKVERVTGAVAVELDQ